MSENGILRGRQHPSADAECISMIVVSPAAAAPHRFSNSSWVARNTTQPAVTLSI
jgi:hypothetical protein